jgi:hypothetical protein
VSECLATDCRRLQSVIHFVERPGAENRSSFSRTPMHPYADPLSRGRKLLDL